MSYPTCPCDQKKTYQGQCVCGPTTKAAYQQGVADAQRSVMSKVTWNINPDFEMPSWLRRSIEGDQTTNEVAVHGMFAESQDSDTARAFWLMSLSPQNSYKLVVESYALMRGFLDKVQSLENLTLHHVDGFSVGCVWPLPNVTVNVETRSKGNPGVES